METPESTGSKPAKSNAKPTASGVSPSTPKSKSHAHHQRTTSDARPPKLTITPQTPPPKTKNKERKEKSNPGEGVMVAEENGPSSTPVARPTVSAASRMSPNSAAEYRRLKKEKKKETIRALKSAKRSQNKQETVSIEGHLFATETNAGGALFPKSLSAVVSKPASKAVSKHKPLRDWKLSQPVGGRFANVSPLFSKDENFLLLIQASTIKIYSTRTSLLARNLSISNPPKSQYCPKIPQNAVIVGYAFHPKETDKLYTVSNIGEIWLWNWLEGSVEGWWSTGLGADTAELGKGGIAVTVFDDEDVFLWMGARTAYVAKVGSERSLRRVRISKPRPWVPDAENVCEVVSVCKLKESITALQVLDSDTFVLVSGKTIKIGNKFKNFGANDTWGTLREFVTNTELTCLDVLSSTHAAEEAGKPSKKGKKAGKTGLDIAVGDAEGVIYVYQDVLKTVNPVEQSVIRRLHWHRSAVATVRWSLDGTYLISGGKETVLVIWQMSTSTKQFLPNLSAAIEDIVVSPCGQDYAVRLGDNSFMIISTTELKARTHIAGIQTRTFANVKDQVLVKAQTSWTVPSVIVPNTPTQVLFATPTTQNEGSSSPYLQVYDTATDRGIARQALSRTLASSKNVSPEGAEVQEPNVKHMAISHDGKWLATVDVWSAPAIDFVDINAPKPPKNATVAREIFLRFWQWNSSAGGNGQWELVTRVDAPHMIVSTGDSAEITNLVASPSALSFTTVGEDGNVKIWKPRSRTRAGVKIVKEGVYVWTCRRIVEITRTNTDDYMDGVVAYSSDGSVLAVAATEEGEAVVYIVDPVSGSIRHHIDALQTGIVCALGFVGQYLIIAGYERLVVWDLVAGITHWTSDISSLVPRKSWMTLGTYVPHVHLATDAQSSTFAIAVNYAKSAKGRSAASNTASQVSIFKVNSRKSVAEQNVASAVVALNSLSAALASGDKSTGGGYMYLDGTATIMFLTPKSAITSARGVPAATEMEDAYLENGGLSNAYLIKPTPIILPSATDVEMDDDSGVKIIRSTALSELFPAPPYASNSLEDVFERFMRLVGQKPLDVDDDELLFMNGSLTNGDAHEDDDEFMEEEEEEEEEEDVDVPESPMLTRQRPGLVEDEFELSADEESS